MSNSGQEPRKPTDTPDVLQGGMALAAEYWPYLVLGALIAMGIISIGGDMVPPGLVWLPPVALVSWFAMAWLLRPRPKRETGPKPEELEEQATLPQPVKKEKPVAAEAEKPVEAKVEEKPAAPAPPAKPKAPPAELDESTVVILWGSESGNAQGLAEMAEERLGKEGMKAQAVDMADMSLEKLQGFKRILVITSTWGDGEPPSNAISLWEEFQKEKVDLAHVQFSVLSLGDTAYPQFCKCGKDFDGFLEEQGGKRIHPRVDCDLDYEQPYEQWISGVAQALKKELVAA